MVDLSTIVGGIKAVEMGIGIVRTLGKSDFKLEKSELKLQMAELMGALAEAKIGLTSSKEQIANLEEEIARLTAFRERTTRSVAGMYLEFDEEGQIIDGAFCSRCYDVDNRFVRILANTKGVRGMGNCPECKAGYKLYEVERLLPDQLKTGAVSEGPSIKIL